MRTRTVIGVVIALVVVLAAVVIGRTLAIKAPSASAIALAPPIPLNTPAAAEHLGQAIRFQTVSHQDPAQDDPKIWAAQRDWLQTTYPHFTALATRSLTTDGMMIYSWKGADPALKPIILMAHQDVVPVDPLTLGRWQAPPFGGVIKDGAVWGRGAIDDKGSLIAVLEAADALAARGFKPRRTVMVISGAHEEADSGQLPATIRQLAAQGLRADFVVDEGPWIYDDAQGPGHPVGMIGVAEKGWAMLRIDARTAGGHSSVPPKETGVGILAKAVLAVIDHPFPLEIKGPSADMLKAIAPNAPFTTRMALANLWLFKPLVLRSLSDSPEVAAQFHTTIAPTLLQGSAKENVLPQDANAQINYRMAPGDSSADVMARAKRAVGKLPVELSFSGYVNEATDVSSQDNEGFRTIAALVRQTEHVPAAPALMAAGTDSRYLAPLTSNIYKFTFVRAPIGESTMLHGVNEHITLNNLGRLMQFYARLIATTAG